MSREPPSGGAVLACRPMGSSGSKPRKKRKAGHPQHLPKVGSSSENKRLLHEEQHAVMDQMGVGRSGSAVKTIATVVIVLMVVGALLSFTLLAVTR